MERVRVSEKHHRRVREGKSLSLIQICARSRKCEADSMANGSREVENSLRGCLGMQNKQQMCQWWARPDLAQRLEPDSVGISEEARTSWTEIIIKDIIEKHFPEQEGLCFEQNKWIDTYLYIFFLKTFWISILKKENVSRIQAGENSMKTHATLPKFP